MRYTMTMPDDMHLKLKVHCAETKQDMSAVINKLVAEYLGKLEKRRPKK
jgi:hypothetical protein